MPRNMQTFREYEEAYFRAHPEEIDDYLTILFEEYAGDTNSAALLTSLRMLARVVGVSRIAEESGMTRKGVQKALSENGSPKFESVNAILHAMGYALMPQKLGTGKSWAHKE